MLFQMYLFLVHGFLVYGRSVENKILIKNSTQTQQVKHEKFKHKLKKDEKKVIKVLVDNETHVIISVKWVVMVDYSGIFINKLMNMDNDLGTIYHKWKCM